MNRLTIFSSSNREDNRSVVFAELCAKILEDQGVEADVVSLQDLPLSLSGSSMYDYESSALSPIVEKYLTPVDKLIFVIPEYNGSFPGILKVFIDSVHPRNFRDKKAALIGISSGRTGNVRGMDHLTNILNYIKVNVYHHKLPIASVDNMVQDGRIEDEAVVRRITEQLEKFLKF